MHHSTGVDQPEVEGRAACRKGAPQIGLKLSAQKALDFRLSSSLAFLLNNVMICMFDPHPIETVKKECLRIMTRGALLTKEGVPS